jgi:hypothetical protein
MGMKSRGQRSKAAKRAATARSRPDLDEACGRVLQLNHLTGSWRYDEPELHREKQRRAIEILNNIRRALRL